MPNQIQFLHEQTLKRDMLEGGFGFKATVSNSGATAKRRVCGNEYDNAFELIAAGARHTFDSFECDSVCRGDSTLL